MKAQETSAAGKATYIMLVPSRHDIPSHKAPQGTVTTNAQNPMPSN